MARITKVSFAEPVVHNPVNATEVARIEALIPAAVSSGTQDVIGELFSNFLVSKISP